MHINHLIWDRIFRDPEFGGLESHNIVKRDPKIDDLRSYNIIETHMYRTCRGIQVYNHESEEEIVYIPSLQTLSALVLTDTWIKQFYMATNAVEKEVLRLLMIPTEIRSNYPSMIHLHRISKDVRDSITMFQINRLKRKVYHSDLSGFYLDKISNVYKKFQMTFDKLSKIGIKHDMESLSKLTILIEHAWNIAIKIFKMCSDLTCNLPSPIRPRYYSILGILVERIHVLNRWHCI